MERLTPMTEFVLEFRNKCESMEHYVDTVQNYANFLKQPLTLGMFVPTDEEGNVLDEPTQQKYGWYSSCSPEEESGWIHEEGEAKYYEALKQWEEAKERVLFEGFMQYTGNSALFTGDEDIYIDEEDCENTNIEQFLHSINTELQLTHSAKKQINGN